MCKILYLHHDWGEQELDTLKMANFPTKKTFHRIRTKNLAGPVGSFRYHSSSTPTYPHSPSHNYKVALTKIWKASSHRGQPALAQLSDAKCNSLGSLIGCCDGESGLMSLNSEPSDLVVFVVMLSVRWTFCGGASHLPSSRVKIKCNSNFRIILFVNPL